MTDPDRPSQPPVDTHDAGTPSRLPRWLARGMSRVYGLEAGRRARRFDRGIGVERIDRPVISVGNLSAGGTGKSPVVRWVVGQLRQHGHRPAIAMRGYKAERGGMSDEQAEHAAELPGVPIVAQPDRIEGLRALFATPEGRGIDCVVLDDGFQHRRLARDLDIVLVDATRPPDRDALLPLGFLREPLSALSRADAVLITRGELVSPDSLARIGARLRGALPDAASVSVAREAWGRIDVVAGEGRGDTLDPDGLRGRRFFVCCGIGNPAAFIEFAGRRGVDVVGREVLPDHARYSAGLAGRVRDRAVSCGADGVLTTGKDWVKLARVWHEAVGGGCAVPVCLPHLGIEVQDFFRAMPGQACGESPSAIADIGTGMPGSGGGCGTLSAQILHAASGVRRTGGGPGPRTECAARG